MAGIRTLFAGVLSILALAATARAEAHDDARRVDVEKHFLNLPVKNGSPARRVRVLLDGKPVREFSMGCADDRPDWWASLDVSAWHGKTLRVEAAGLPRGSAFLSTIEQADAPHSADDLYHEPARPQFHFSPARGWNNDPNGLVYFGGEYHLFFQFNPYGTRWGNMHWGHAVSKDLVHWKELPIALYPDATGPMFSGSAVVDWDNTSGLGTTGRPPMVLIYTAAGQPSVQCLAFSDDGRTFTKFAGNPVVRQITGGNRDPKVQWYAPTGRWVMVLYAGFPPAAGQGPKPGRRDTIQFLTSTNLRDWSVTGEVEGFYECPDLFPLAVGSDPRNVKWVLTAASSDYMLGRFDGRTFVPETGKLKGNWGRGFYAAQTFADLPRTDGRRVQIGWFQTACPNAAFNQSMTVPQELKLVPTPDGPRLARVPVKELESLRIGDEQKRNIALHAGRPPVRLAGGELLDVRAELQVAGDASLTLSVRGVPIRYDAASAELSVDNLHAPVKLRDGTLTLTVLADRNGVEIFANDGLTYVPIPIMPKASEHGVSVSADRGHVLVRSLAAYRLKSIWE